MVAKAQLPGQDSPGLCRLPAEAPRSIGRTWRRRRRPCEARVSIAPNLAEVAVARIRPVLPPGSPRRPGGRCPLTVPLRPTLGNALRLGRGNSSRGYLPPRSSAPGGVSFLLPVTGRWGVCLWPGAVSVSASLCSGSCRDLHTHGLPLRLALRISLAQVSKALAPTPFASLCGSLPPGSLPLPPGREAPPETEAEAAGPDAFHACPGTLGVLALASSLLPFSGPVQVLGGMCRGGP